MEKQLNRNVNISLADGKQVTCAKCGGKYFMEMSMFYRFSALLTGQPKDSLMPIPVMMCGQCSTPLEDLLPNELKQSKPKIDLNNITIQS